MIIYKRVRILLVLTLWGLNACATSPAPTSPSDGTDQGDRALKQGIHWYQKGCSRKAMEHLHAAHEYYSITDQQAGVARSLDSLANIYRHSGDVPNAILFYDAAIAAARRCDNQTVVAQALSNKAALLINAGDVDGAEVLLDEAQLLSRETGPVFAMVLNHRAVLLMKAQHFEEARNLLDQADTAAVDNDFTAGATIRFTRGRLMMKLGNYPQAMRLFQEALDLDRQAGFSRGMADDLFAMAEIHERLGRDGAALDCLNRSLKIHALLENREVVLANIDRLRRLAEKTGTNIRVTVHFINQWLAGETVDAFCR